MFPLFSPELRNFLLFSNFERGCHSTTESESPLESKLHNGSTFFKHPTLFRRAERMGRAKCTFRPLSQFQEHEQEDV